MLCSGNFYYYNTCSVKLMFHFMHPVYQLIEVYVYEKGFKTFLWITHIPTITVPGETMHYISFEHKSRAPTTVSLELSKKWHCYHFNRSVYDTVICSTFKVETNVFCEVIDVKYNKKALHCTF